MTIAMHGRTKRLAVGVLALGTTAVLVAACSGSGNSGAGSAKKAASAPASGTAPASASIVVTKGHLATASGRTVYLWVADTGAKSVCSGACASVWPPVPASVEAGTGVSAAKLTTIDRPGGGTQLAYAGHPLYFYAADSAAGQATGQGSDSFGAKWWELDATGRAITATSGSSAGSPSSASGGGYHY